MEGNEDNQPFMTGRMVLVKPDEALKILNTVPHEKCVSTVPQKPRGGDIYVYQPAEGTDSHQEPWKEDKHRWRCTSSQHLPRYTRPTIFKQTYTLYSEEGTVLKGCRKEIYRKEDESEGCKVLIHFMGDFTGLTGHTTTQDSQHEPEADDGGDGPVAMETESEEGIQADTTTEGDQATIQTSDPDTTPDKPDTSVTGIPPRVTRSTRSETSTVDDATTAGASPEPSTSAIPDSSSSQPDLESAMKMVKAALAGKQGNKPAMVDMFSKLIDSVKKDDGLEFCLVVSDKKSGDKSFIGSPTIAPSDRVLRKRGTSGQADTDSEGEDGQQSPVSSTSRSNTAAKLVPPPENYEVTASNGEVIKFAAPEKENFFSFNIISDEEKTIHSDFFADRRKSSKSEERYLKIRNHMILLWQNSKPQFVGKSLVRKGLRDCGDVTCMSRIHTYLTCKGVINFNAVKGSNSVSSTPARSKSKKRRVEEDDDVETPANKEPRKTKTPASSRTKQTGRSDATRNHNDSNVGEMADDVNTPSATRSSSRRRRNVATPNWADIMSGKKSFKEDGAMFYKVIKTEPGSGDDEDVVEMSEPDSQDGGDDAAELRAGKLGRRATGQGGQKSPRRNIDGGEAMDQSVKKEKAGARQVKVIGPDDDDKDGDGKVEDNEKVVAGDDVEEVEYLSREKRSRAGAKAMHKYPCKICARRFVSFFMLEQHVMIDHASGKEGKDGAQKASKDGIEDNTDGTEGTVAGGMKLPNVPRSSGDTDYEVVEGDDDDDFADQENVEDGDYQEDDKDQSDDSIPQEDEDSDFVLEESEKKMASKSKGKIRIGKLKKREARVKPSTGETPECKICGTQFLSIANLRRHTLLHTDKMYECPYCAKLMKRKDYVLSHVKKVHKEIDLNENPIDFDKFTHTVDREDVEGAEVKVSEDEDDGEIVENEDLDMEEEDDQEEGEGGGVAGTGEKKKRRTTTKLLTGLGKKVCPECNQLFDNHSDLEQHMILVHDKDLQDAAYMCPACKKQFKTLVSYQVHKLSHRKKEFVCPHCSKRFPTNSQLQVHKRRDHQIQYGTLMYFGFLTNNERITCEICSSDFDSMDDYLDHRSEHVTFEHLCRDCGNGFDNEDDLERHKETGCTEQNLHLPCGVCNARFSMYDTRRKHVLMNHPKNNHNYCHHCGKHFDDIESLRTHFATHKQEKIFVCEACEKTFFEKRNLIDHRELHRSSKNFQCDICLKFYISPKSLQRHIKLHLSKNMKACKYCPEKFNNVVDFNNHMKKEHALETSLNDVIPCPKCQRTFNSSSKLAKHMQLHTDEPSRAKYLCVYCNCVFDSNETPLWKHMKAEHPEVKDTKGSKQFNCRQCGFTSAHKQRMERHMETHNPNKEFVCKYCLKRYQTTSSLMTHMITHRGKIKKGSKPEPICTWPGCIKQFMKHSLYKRHLVSHIFKVKTGKDLCDCGKCMYSGSQGKKYLFSGTVSNLSAVGFVDVDGNSHVASQLKQKISDGGSQVIEVNVSEAAENDGYQSMEVLHEAIAQIEDIEKSNDNLVTGATSVHAGAVSDGAGTNEMRGLEDHSLSAELAGDNVATNPEAVLNKPGTLRHVVTATGMSDCTVDSQVVMETQMLDVGVSTDNIDDELTEDDVTTGKEDIADDGSIEAVRALVDQASKDKVATGVPVIAINEDGTDSITILGKDAITAGVTTGTSTTETVSGYECGVCELMFIYKCQVLVHFESEHPDFKFPHCDVCGKCMTDKKSLADHKLIHEAIRRFSCNECGRKFRTKQCLRQHSFIHSELKPFTCEHCGHGFTQRGFYEEHLRRHLGLKPFKCAMCSKNFVSKNMLKIHMYSHTGNRPYTCEYCSKTFTEKYHLQNHVRNHVDDRPFQCSECHKSFCVKPKLIRHMTAVHGVEKELLSNYYPTKVGEGIGYRSKPNAKPPMLRTIEPRKTQVVYIDARGNIVHQAMKTDSDQIEVIPKPEEQVVELESTGLPQYKVTEDMTPVHLEVVTQRDADGNIQTIVPPQFLTESLISLPEEGEMLPSEDGVVYQEIPEEGEVLSTDEGVVYQEIQTNHGVNEGESIELDGQNYTLVTTDASEGGHLQLITQALAGAQPPSDMDDGQIQVITQEVASMDELGVESADNIQVITDGEIGDAATAGDGSEVQKFSINIQEDGTVNASDIEALRNLYSDQQIVIVLENQPQ